MGKGRFHQSRQRFEDVALNNPPQDGASFYFDLKLMLPPGMTGRDIQRARQAVEHRLLRILRKKDRVVWSGDGFFLVIATSHPARAGAAAERIHQDICAMLAGRNFVQDAGASRTAYPLATHPTRENAPARGRDTFAPPTQNA